MTGQKATESVCEAIAPDWGIVRCARGYISLSLFLLYPRPLAADVVDIAQSCILGGYTREAALTIDGGPVDGAGLRSERLLRGLHGGIPVSWRW